MKNKKRDLNGLRLSKKTISKFENDVNKGGTGLPQSDRPGHPSCHGGQTCNQQCTVTCPTNEIQ